MAVVLFTCILAAICFRFGSSQIFTPPPPGEKPVISNGIVYNLRHIPVECQEPRVLEVRQINYGMVLPENKKWAIMKIYSPYKIQGNIEIPPNTCLYIEPGVTMYFGPGFGMIVNGTLIARVNCLCSLQFELDSHICLSYTSASLDITNRADAKCLLKALQSSLLQSFM